VANDKTVTKIKDLLVQHRGGLTTSQIASLLNVSELHTYKLVQEAIKQRILKPGGFEMRPEGAPGRAPRLWVLDVERPSFGDPVNEFPTYEEKVRSLGKYAARVFEFLKGVDGKWGRSESSMRTEFPIENVGTSNRPKYVDFLKQSVTELQNLDLIERKRADFNPDLGGMEATWGLIEVPNEQGQVDE
jgi:hypothetical protein